MRYRRTQKEYYTGYGVCSKELQEFWHCFEIVPHLFLVSSNGGVERSPCNAGALKARLRGADFRSNDLLAARESARGAFSNDYYIYSFISILHAKNKSG